MIDHRATLTELSACELASLIARREVSASEVVEDHIERIDAVNERLNAIVVKRYDDARAEASDADRRCSLGAVLPPLHGVPVTIKESLDLAGTPSTYGLPSLKAVLAERDDPYVSRFRAAGAIVLGKTNVSQILLHAECDNPVYGRTNNPWHPFRTCGGSSGGEGAIIAAGGSPLGLGTDIGGSVRYPAAFCGIASIKPTTGRTPDYCSYTMPKGQQAITGEMGVLARNVADLAVGLEIIGGMDSQAGLSAPLLGDYRSVDVSRLRVGWYADDGSFPVSIAVRRAVREAVDALRSSGAEVGEWAPPDVLFANDLYLGIMSADGGEVLRERMGANPRDPRIGQLMLLAARSRATLGLLERLLRLSGQPMLARSLHPLGHRDTAHYWLLVEALADYRRRFADAMNRDGKPLDLILCPATSLPAWRHGAGKELLTGGAYTLLYNLLGYPAGVAAVTRVRPEEQDRREPTRDLVMKRAHDADESSVGLPIAVQLAARPWREDAVLAAMQVIERAARNSPDYPRTPVE